MAGTRAHPVGENGPLKRFPEWSDGFLTPRFFGMGTLEFSSADTEGIHGLLRTSLPLSFAPFGASSNRRAGPWVW